MAKNKTIFQRLTDVVIGLGTGTGNSSPNKVTSYNISTNKKNDVLYTFDNKAERDLKLSELKQQKLLAHQWGKMSYDTSIQQLAGSNQVRVMYRDADLMDAWPEIGTALDIVAEEATCINSKGKMLNISSPSPRIVSVLEDLFINRLDIFTTLPMIVRATAKYGNEFMLLNIDSNNGVLGWREMPVHEIQRVENGVGPFSYGFAPNNVSLKQDEVKFVWEGHTEGYEFRNWQVAHFRLLKDSIYSPYGASYLNKARRAWRMLSMMEDAMLLYRLERSIERRIFKVNVGLIDDADVQPFLQEFMNNVKRAPIIDPQTGQIDLRKNFLDVSADYVIPVRQGQDPTSIESLASAQNITSMDDIDYMKEKILSAFKMPKSFLNFQEAQGKGQNLALMDIRFNRAINSVQQPILMELTKIAIIHLYLLGFVDDITNFSLTLNNPSNQMEVMELDNMSKRLGNAANALAEQGGGIPIMSWHKVQKEIMGLTDAEISDMLQEIRLEKAIAAELEMTNQIIKKTGLFKKVDRIYGEPGAQYQPQQQQDDGGMGGLGGGGAMGGGAPMGDFGDDLGGLGEPGMDEGADLGGDEGATDLSNMGGNEGGSEPLTEERKIVLDEAFNKYMKLINKGNEKQNNHVEMLDKSFIINEDLDSAIKSMDKTFEESRKLLNEDKE